jgi:dephospho-CoA kinase
MIIIGITGTLGAGKGTVVDFLANEHKFTHFSVREFLAEIIRASGQEVNRDTLTHTANDLRRQYGPAYIIEQLFNKAAQTGNNCIIESIRTPGEIEALRRHKSFVLLAVDADIKVRFDRVIIRNSETDNIDFQTFRSNEEREMYSKDPNHQNLSECIKQADYIIDNSGNRDDLHLKTSEIISKIQKEHRTGTHTSN